MGACSGSTAARTAGSPSSASTTRPQILFVRGGTLDEPASVAPDVHIFTRSKLPWVVLPEGVPAFAVYYDSKTLWPAASLERLNAALGRA